MSVLLRGVLVVLVVLSIRPPWNPALVRAWTPPPAKSATPTPPPSLPKLPADAPAFAERWPVVRVRTVAVPDAEALQQSALLGRPLAKDETRVPPDPVPSPQQKPPWADASDEPPKHKAASTSLCERHGMKQVWVNARSWRCKRG